ncbi:MAG: hypothetical protein J7L45_02705 [Candidatus Aenigmarchaeota archaeon]|nr:hypothetical protein [Candidatus Aenigmarchaeota archaeon]
MSFTPSIEVTEKRPEWPEQIRSPEELEVEGLYEVWHRDESDGKDELKEIVQIAGKPEKEGHELRVPIIKLFSVWDKAPAEGYLYLSDHSIVPYSNDVLTIDLCDGEYWNNFNHLKRHPSRAYEKLAKE